jgi:hypothetical protein
MDPSKKRRRNPSDAAPASEQEQTTNTSATPQQSFGEETELDRQKDLADAERKNLWDATEVIDMDKV